MWEYGVNYLASIAHKIIFHDPNIKAENGEGR